MILICEECGKKYQTKGTLKADKARFQCRECSHVITISKADVAPENRSEEVASDFQSVLLSEGTDDINDMGQVGSVDDFSAPKTADPEMGENSIASAADTSSQTGMSLRTKMMFLFLFVPVFLFAIAGLYYLVQMDRFANTLTSESAAVVKKLGENKIKDISRMVAVQCKQYLAEHPEMTREKFMDDPVFSKIATQRVGLTGYAAIYSGAPFTTWAHPNRRIVGKPLLPIVKTPLGDDYNRFYKIAEEVDKGNMVESFGYYLWPDPDGALREKFMMLTPIEGTDYGVTATVYMDEFTQPIRKVERKADKITRATRNFTLAALGTILLLMAVIVFFYAHRITNRIKNLTDLAERISVGEMDAEIKIDTKDEIGTLGEAIGRMQNSIRLSIERLRKRM